MMKTSRMLYSLVWLAGTVVSVHGSSIFDPPGYWSFAVRDSQTVAVCSLFFLYVDNGRDMRSNKKILVMDNAGCVSFFLANGEC